MAYNTRAESDDVNHPTHYTSHPSGVECITIAEWHTMCVGNAIKYLWRAGLKGVVSGDRTKEVEDLRKAAWYATREADRLEAMAYASDEPLNEPLNGPVDMPVWPAPLNDANQIGVPNATQAWSRAW